MTRDVEQVLKRVARRQALVAIGRASFIWTAIFAASLALAILGGRLLALWPDFFEAWMILAVPGLGLLVGLVVHRRPNLEGAARAADRHRDTEDLFLTNLQSDTAPGKYQVLVEQKAKAEAGLVRPGEIVPLPFLPRAVIVVAALFLLWMGHQYLPQFDPFGSVEQRILLGQRSKQLVEETKATKERKQALKEKKIDDRNSNEIDQALKEVVKTFRGLRKNPAKKNAQRLKVKQAEIGRQWRDTRQKHLAGGSSSPSLQKLGRLGGLPKFKKWEKELSSGNSQALRRELKALRDLVNKLSDSTDEKEKEKIRKELAERTKDLADFLKQTASSKELNETLAKALNQIQGLGTPKLSDEAEAALKQSFELSEMELKALAQGMRDMNDLESAMEALQAARNANAKGKTGKGSGMGQGQGDGPGEEPGLGAESGMSPAEAMQAYLEYYEGLAEDQMQEPGGGMGGPGRGEGGVAPEDSSLKNKFKTEKSRSALKAGKILMNLKTKEAGDRGQITKEYEKGVEQLKQGVSEAIQQERVPPGYHQGIKKYFDDLGKPPGKAKKK